MLRAIAPALALAFCACGARLESRREFYAGTRQLRYEGHAQRFDDEASLAQGAWCFWYRDGVLQARGDFADGDLVRADDEHADLTCIPIHGRSGRWTSWNERGVEISEGSYRSGLREGVWFEWHDDGALKSRTEFVHGRIEGPRVTWHPNGVMCSEGAFHAGRECGIQSEWDANGVLRKQRDCEDGRAAGVARTWDECGVLREEAEYTDGLLNGTRSLWDADGRLGCVTQYVRGLPNGEQVLYHKNGRVKEASSLVRGKQDGLVSAYDETNREVWRLACSARDATQRMITWHPNGAPCAERCALGRLPEGLQREWYDDGRPRSCGVRVAGRMEGDWRFWTRAGDIDRERSGVYVAGVKRR